MSTLNTTSVKYLLKQAIIRQFIILLKMKPVFFLTKLEQFIMNE